MSRNNVGLLPIAVLFYNTDIFCMFGNGYICEESSQRAVFCFLHVSLLAIKTMVQLMQVSRGSKTMVQPKRGEAEHKVNGGKGARSTMFGPLPRTGATDNHLYKSNAFNRTGQQPVVMR